MSDLIELYVIMVILYLVESIILIEEDSVILSEGWQSFKISYKKSGYVWGKKVLKFLNPFLPFRDIFITEFPIISFSPAGISSKKSNELFIKKEETDNKSYYAYEEIERVEVDDNKVYINNNIFLICNSNLDANMTASLVNKLKATNKENILNYIDIVMDSLFNYDALEEKLKSFNSKSSYLKSVTMIYWAYLFIFLPVIIFEFTYINDLYLPLFFLLFLHLSTNIILFVTNKDLFKKSNNSEFFANFIKVVLSPFAACWANFILSKDYLIEFHPIIVLKKMANERDFIQYGGQTIREYLFTNDLYNSDSLEYAIIKWNREKVIEKIDKFLSLNDLDISDFITFKNHFDKQAKSYCPRCLVEYTFVTGKCSNCEGINLIEAKDIE